MTGAIKFTHKLLPSCQRVETFSGDTLDTVDALAILTEKQLEAQF